MPSHFHAVIWIDHSQARIFHFGLGGSDEITLHPHLATRHLHHKANAIGSGHAAPDKAFYTEVTKAVADAGEILIIGPASAKTELADHIHASAPDLAKRIVAVEAADHPSDAEIVAYAKRHFKMPLPRVQTPGSATGERHSG
ncbi:MULTISPECIES: translational machinery protein [Bradyrhizobium]|uniref:Translational machinery protein n=2 Tax=Bradyrhizobium diversitatis TaxID=2755406 RepID=A0ABS0PAV0_9BRAD|nr:MULTISPECIES: translational machinery protein [Bradyrhizobium]MBH5390433.1 translational machinery protein [Bradyrhizobium diversitatis]UPJ66189.1 translational machinery protein [Bradyrhizobium sp. 191]